MSGRHPIEGRWVSRLPGSSDDYLVEYGIRFDGDAVSVTAIELRDQEEMKISDVGWDGETLSFRSLMPSTGRVGMNRFRLMENGDVESKFTFTVVEALVRRPSAD